MKTLSADKDAPNKIPVASRIGEHEDFASPGILHDSVNISAFSEGKKECSHLDRVCALCDEESSTTGTVFSEVEKKQACNEVTCLIISNLNSQSTTNVNESDSLEWKSSFVAEECTENVLKDSSSGHYHDVRLSSKQDEDRYSEVSSISCHSTSAKNDSYDTRTSEPSSCSLSGAAIDHQDQHDLCNTTYCEFGEWIVAWDAFYMRYYFHNSRTLESTWDTPAELDLTISYPTCSPLELFAGAIGQDGGIDSPCGSIRHNHDHALQDRVDIFQKGGKDVNVFNQSSSEVLHDTSAAGLEFEQNVRKNESEHVLNHGELEQNSNEKVPLRLSCAKFQASDDQDENDILGEAWNVCESSRVVPIDSSLTTELSELGLEENYKRSALEADISLDDDLEIRFEIVTIKKKKRIRRPPRLALEGESGGLSANIVKYWHQRYLLFSQFDNGIKMDEEGWFSVTPESIARHHASRCGNGIVIDCFTGVGGNAIQFASKSSHVVAVDIDPQKIDYARNNAAVYGVGDKIDFVNADFFKIAPRLKGDTLYLSPPWGGPDYTKVQTYDIQRMLKPCDGSYLFSIARTIASKVVMFLPRNVDLNQLAELSLSTNPPWSLEVEKNILNGKLKAITAYFVNVTT